MTLSKTSENPVSLNRDFEKDSFNETPILRIGITELKDHIDFKSSGKISIFNNEGIALLKNVTTPGKWRIKLEQSYPARYNYIILLGTFFEYESAKELVYRLIEKGLGAQITTLGDKLYFRNQVINNNTQYRVIIDNFHSEQQANFFAHQVLNDYNCKIVNEKIQEAGATLEIFDAEFEKFAEAENVIRIVPESPEVITSLYDVTVENGVTLPADRHYTFQGVLEFRSDEAGKLTIISETPLEKYIEWVMALNLKSEYPPEALKANAITIRSKTIASLRIIHHNEPYDLCASSHCQRFAGLLDSSTNMFTAVKETMGQIITNNDKIVNADYNLICGGYTENPSVLSAELMNTPDTKVFDSDKLEQQEKYGDLSEEKNIKNWIDTEPDVFCNNNLNYLKKYFRWEITFLRKELEDIISEKERKIIGILYDIIPIKRTSSGRITEIEIIASNTNLIISGEMNIRSKLARESLNSSCFYIRKEIDEEGIPLSFTFCGAGMGHGVGLCQAGAVTMAEKGYNYRQILSHYFRGTNIEKIY